MTPIRILVVDDSVVIRKLLADTLMRMGDRKSTRLNSSHQIISYAVFCLKKKKTNATTPSTSTPLISCKICTDRRHKRSVADSSTGRATPPPTDGHTATSQSHQGIRRPPP